MWKLKVFFSFYSCKISFQHKGNLNLNRWKRLEEKLSELWNYRKNFLLRFREKWWYLGIVRSSHRRYSVKKGVLRNFSQFTGKRLCQSPFLNKVAGLNKPAALLKKRLWRRCFPVNFAGRIFIKKRLFWHRCFCVNFAKFLRAPFLQNTGWLFLNLWHPESVYFYRIYFIFFMKRIIEKLDFVF